MLQAVEKLYISTIRAHCPPPFSTHSPSPSVALPKLSQAAAPTSSSTVVKKKKRPSFRFSKSELVTLASFKDKESADQVIQWLGLQAKLD